MYDLDDLEPEELKIINDELNDFLSDHKCFYFDRNIKIPFKMGDDRVAALNLLFRQKDIPVYIEDSHIKLVNDTPNSVRLTFENFNILRGVLENLLSTYLVLDNSFSMDEYSVKSSYVDAASAPSKDDISLIERTLDCRYVDDSRFSNSTSLSFDFNSTNDYSLTITKNTDGFWGASLNGFAQTSFHIKEYNIDKFLSLVKEEIIATLTKTNNNLQRVIDTNNLLKNSLID